MNSICIYTKILITEQKRALNNVYVLLTADFKLISISEAQPQQKIDLSFDLVVPQFANVHCHTELSYAHNLIPKHIGINAFITALEKLKTTIDDTQQLNAIPNALKQIKNSGTVALGDICNTNKSIVAKKNSLLYIHNFIETYGFSANRAESQMAIAKSILSEFAINQLKGNIVPHAPYSVSKELAHLINDTLNQNFVCTIHMQESIAENDFFINGKGLTYDRIKSYGIDLSNWKSANKTSLAYYLPFLPINIPTILVHNTFTTIDDVELAVQNNSKLNWCLCPNANKYIENTLPNIPMLMSKKIPICIGTDSLASNDSLNIWNEIATIHGHYSSILFEDLVHWATYNGYQALQLPVGFNKFTVGNQLYLNGINLSSENYPFDSFISLQALN